LITFPTRSAPTAQPFRLLDLKSQTTRRFLSNKGDRTGEHMNKLEERLSRDEAARRVASQPSDMLTPAQWNAEQRLRPVMGADPREQQERADEEALEKLRAELGGRFFLLCQKIKRAAGDSGEAAQLAGTFVNSLEREFRRRDKRGGPEGVAVFMDETERDLPGLIEEVGKVADAEIRRLAEANEQRAEGEAKRSAAGMSTSQAMAWFASRGFRLRLRKDGRIEVAPAGALDRAERAMLRLHKDGLVRLLLAQNEWRVVE
jgi:hypothetical protein